MKAVAAALNLAAAVSSVQGYIPTAYIDIRRTHSNLDGINIEYLFRIEATESTFAPQPPKGHPSYTTNPLGKSDKLPSQYSSYPIVRPPESDPFLCNEATGTSNYLNPVGSIEVEEIGYLYKKYVLVPRGQCSFEAKARSAQRLGAAGVMIYNTLHSRYESIDPTKQYVNNPKPDWGNIKWPEERIDYECGTYPAKDGVGLRFEVETSRLYWNPPPYNELSDNFLTGWVDDGNLCAQDYEGKGGTADGFRGACPSERCLLTGRNVSEDGSVMEACCAWDLPVQMSSDGDDGDAVPQSQEEDVVIPSFFISMEDAKKLLAVTDDSADSTNVEGAGSVYYISAVPYAKWYPKFHYSTVVLWAMAVFTVWISCYESASEYRKSWKVISEALNEGILVFSRNSVAPSPNLADAVGGRRERADTDETVDLADDVLEVEMPETNGNGEESTGANVHDLNFQIDEDFDVNGNGGRATEAHTSTDGSTAAPDTSTGVSPNANDEVVTDGTEERMETIETNAPAAEDSTTASTQAQQQQTQQVNANSLLQSRAPSAAERRVELHAMHAFFFVICASAILLLLFFFNLFKIVTIIYGFGGSACMNLIIIQPLVTRFLPAKYAQMEVPYLKSLGLFTLADVVSSATSYSIGFAWIIIAFTRANPLQNTYYWVIQDVLGICYCIYVMGIIHINTIMVGTILLVLVFFYDIFYVFLSPYIFGTSVMVDVATGGVTSGEALFCYKYPSDYRCSGSGAPLPMMLVFPWILDYRGGFSMIGLGDIVLPGLLISFAARYDGAKFLTRKVSETNSSGTNGTNGSEGDNALEGMEYDPTVTRKQAVMNGVMEFFKILKKGYFAPMMIAYAVGLSAAYAAVYGMKRGQPALLYIVPACLGMIFALGLKKRQLSDLWRGPKIMLKANRIVSLANKIPQLRAAAATAPRNNLPDTTVV
ncbi:hypothetical protein ACHAXN_004775 [Cyclotella atomus]